MTISNTPIEAVVQTFLTKERNWTSITSFPSTAASLPLFHGLPDKRVYTSPDDQKRYLRASASLRADLEQIHAGVNKTTTATKTSSSSSSSKSINADDEHQARAEKLAQQQSTLERYYQAPRGEFVACVPMNPTRVSASKGDVTEHISGDVLEATFAMIRRLKDSVPSLRAEDADDVSAAEDVLWEKGREVGETQRPSDPPARLLLAVVDTDSTIGFYFVHDGLVPPRQN